MHRRGGFTLVEVMMAMSILLVSLLALASMQIIGSRGNRAADRIVQASAMATDLAENIRRWSYTDSRLNAITTLASTTDPTITGKWDMGSGTTASYQAEYSDMNPDPNASNPGALGSTYQGLSTYLTYDAGTPDFVRYWNVFAINSTTNSAQPNGKLVQIIVRWPEPGYGYRQVTASTFKLNPNAFSQ